MVAALLFAVAPWAVVYSRKLWANDFLPLFVMGWAWTGFRPSCGKAWWLIAHALVVGRADSIALLGVDPGSRFGHLVYRLYQAVSWRAVLIAAAVFVLLFAPFLIADADAVGRM